MTVNLDFEKIKKYTPHNDVISRSCFRRTHRSAGRSFNFHLPAPPVINIMRVPLPLSLSLVFLFLSPIFLCCAFYHPPSCCDWHFIRRVEVLSLDLYCDTVACSAFINLFLPVCATQALTSVTASAYKLETSLLPTFISDTQVASQWC